MKRITLLVLPLAALLLNTSCVDSSYDLSNIDTTSRFMVNGLTLPVNLEPVKLDKMLDISDDSDIKTDAEGNYYFCKSGSFSSGNIKVNKIVFAKPKVDFNGGVAISINLDPAIKSKLEMEPFCNLTIGQILDNPTYMELVGINLDTPILDIEFGGAKTSSNISLAATGIDKNVRSINYLGLDQTTLSIIVKVQGIQNVLNPFSVSNLKLIMPRGLSATTKPGTTYNLVDGTLVPDDGELKLDPEYTADLSLTAFGIYYDLLAEGEQKIFDPEKHTFTYNKQCSVSGKATLKVSDLKRTAKYADIVALEQPNAVTYDCNIGFDNDIAISSFVGEITYSMDDIKVNPVNIGNIPDLLKEKGTNIDLKNPQIYLDVENNLSKYGIGVKGTLEIKGNNIISADLNINDTESTKLVMAPLNEDLYHTDYTFQEVKGLSGVVGSKGDQAFPEQLNIRVIEPTVPKTMLAEAFELGKDLEGVNGKWEFYTRLSLTGDTEIKYTKEWTDWSSEDLNGLTINSAVVNVTLKKEVAIDVRNVNFVLTGKEGKLAGETAIMGDTEQDITIKLTGTPVRGIKSGKLDIHLNGMNKDINKNQEIQISNLKLTVDGYYDKSF